MPLRSGFDWGEGGGLAAAATLFQYLGGAYLDFTRNIAVGFDGVYVRSYALRGRQIQVELANQLAALPYPYTTPLSIDTKIIGVPVGQYEVVVNGTSCGIVSIPSETGIRVAV